MSFKDKVQKIVTEMSAGESLQEISNKVSDLALKRILEEVPGKIEELFMKRLKEVDEVIKQRVDAAIKERMKYDKSV